MFSSPYVLSTLISLIVFLSLYAFLVPRNNRRVVATSQMGDETVLTNFVKAFGSDLFAALPKGVDPISKNNPRIKELLVRSGNPWKVSVEEFQFYQYTLAAIGVAVGVFLSVLVPSDMMPIPIPTIVLFPLILGSYGFVYISSKYSSEAKRRDIEFTRFLPESLDLINISLSAGATFEKALRDTIPNMAPSALKDEFREIVKQLDTGVTLDEALASFGNRTPNPGVESFVSSIREANRYSTPLVDIVRSRSEASRSDFFSFVTDRVARMGPLMMASLSGTMMPALMIIIIAPSIMSIAEGLA